MLKVAGISKSFVNGHCIDAVADVSFQLDKGSFLAITGRSGSGKSTLLGMIGGISRPSGGTVELNGTDQWLLNDDVHSDFRNKNIGFVFQFSSLLPTLRAIDNVALPALISAEISKDQAYARAHALLERVGLTNRMDSYPGELSGGERRRVAIARALINSPELLLADEPTADLDERTEEEILNLLIDIHRTLGLTLVVVTHNPQIAQRADRLLNMDCGQAKECTKQEPRPATEEDPQGSQYIFQDNPAPIENIKLGEGIERLIGRFFLWAVVFTILIGIVNSTISYFESSAIKAKTAQQDALEELAMRGIRADVKDVTFGPNHTYVLSMYVRNTIGTQPIFVMSPRVRAFVQVGSSWQEVPLKPIDSSPDKVLKITGTQLFHYTIEPGITGFAQLIPHYMHVRISNDMVVSPSEQPKNDLFERSDNYYVYLKPHDADDAAILRKLKFPGKPPVWIPMPPH